MFTNRVTTPPFHAYHRLRKPTTSRHQWQSPE
jgi:hypothetical protein